MTSPTISIAMATYNGAKYIDEQLDSIARQTVLPAELVITDDNSTDSTLDRIEAFAATAPFPVRLQKNPKNLGYRANFMKAISMCTGDLIAFSDQDDVWLPEKLATCRAAFRDQDVLFAYHNATVVDEHLQPIGTLDHDAAPQALNPPLSCDKRPSGYGFTFVIHKSLTAFNDFWQQSNDVFNPATRESHDNWFFFLGSCLGFVAYIPQPLALYRRHGTNISAWRANKTFGRYGILHLLKVFLSSNIQSIKSRELFARNHADAMQWGAAGLPPRIRHNAARAAEGYRRLQANCRRRRELYASSAIGERLRKIIQINSAGGYAPTTQWGDGHKALARDILRSLVAPMRVPLD